MSLPDPVIIAFKEQFGGPPVFLARGPGRVNLIGEHTDYNDGFVMPVAIDRALWIALRPRHDGQTRLVSLDMGGVETFALDALHHDALRGDDPRRETGWVEYVKGVAWALQSAGYALRGWEGVMAGDIPIGAGLSSSAALEMAAARAYAAVSGFDFVPPVMARLGQRAENEWVGVNTGIMDQMISAAGREDHALLIDCRTLATEAVPLPANTAVVVLDTGTRRGLVDSAYNERRRQCEAAAAHFGVAALRDVDEATFHSRAQGLDDLIYRRARHVVTENERVMRAREAMLAGDPAALGRILNAGHLSLRDDFEVSGLALDAIVETAQSHPACYGARMTGGGFAGCAVALVDAGEAADFAAQVGPAYRTRTGLEPQLFVCRAAAGASLEVLS